MALGASRALVMVAVTFGFVGAVQVRPAPAATGPVVSFERGVSVGEWGKTAYEPRHTKRLLTRLARVYRANSVTLFVDWLQRDPRSTTIRPGEQTAPTRNLVRAIRTARRLRMQVVLRPYFDIQTGGWRGQVRPRSVDRWFSSYRRFILRYAALAQRERVAILEVGSEMRSLSGMSRRWRSLVGRVRKVFRGTLTYNANWDEVTAVDWWDALDVISVSAYFPLSTAPNPSLSQLVEGWHSLLRHGARRSWFGDLDKLRSRFEKGVRFGEIGYRPVERAAVAPWDISGGKRSQAAQTRAYEAAFRVWYRVPWFKGFSWWFMYPQADLLAGKPGADHEPLPATLDVLRRWHSAGR